MAKAKLMLWLIKNAAGNTQGSAVAKFHALLNTKRHYVFTFRRNFKSTALILTVCIYQFKKRSTNECY
jgi:hypothetical protein